MADHWLLVELTAHGLLVVLGHTAGERLPLVVELIVHAGVVLLLHAARPTS